MTLHAKLFVTLIIGALLSGMALMMLLQSDFGFPTPTPPESSESHLPSRDQLLKLVNEERSKFGAKPLVEDPRLDISAQVKATDMLVNDYFEHKDSKGKVGYSYMNDFAPSLCQNVAENLSYGTGEYDNSQSTVTGWINSKDHHEAMIDSQYTLTGFGIDNGYVVEHFCQAR